MNSATSRQLLRGLFGLNLVKYCFRGYVLLDLTDLGVGMLPVKRVITSAMLASFGAEAASCLRRSSNAWMFRLRAPLRLSGLGGGTVGVGLSIGGIPGRQDACSAVSGLPHRAGESWAAGASVPTERKGFVMRISVDR
jgi:hypothetical protein